jgi:catechol 2,3-dioxygenase-like lactoylglutathione lyase family enzyme
MRKGIELKGKIHHIELYVSDLKKSIDFWGWMLEKLGYHLYQKWEEGISWRKDDTYLVLVQTQEKYLNIPYHRCGTGLNHIAFFLDSKQEVDDFTTLLKQRGIDILYEDRHPYAGGTDYYALYCEDPDRIKIELVAEVDK